MGHPSRIISVNLDVLKLFVNLYDDEGVAEIQARLPALHSQNLIAILEKFARQEKCLDQFKNRCSSTVMLDETAAQKDGTIRRDTQFAEDSRKLVLSGPHFFVGNPLDRKSTRLNSSHPVSSRMPSSA